MAGAPKNKAKTKQKARVPSTSELESELSVLLEKPLPGASLNIRYAERWKRNQITILWDGFNGLLPEERFRLAMQAIPEKLYKERLSQFVWFELTPVESESDLMAMPRSEDIAERSAEISRTLLQLGFFDQLAQRLQPDPTKSCGGRLQISREVLRTLGQKQPAVTDACLLLIRHHAFCDCQALIQARSAIESEAHAVRSQVKQGKHGKRMKPAHG